MGLGFGLLGDQDVKFSSFICTIDLFISTLRVEWREGKRIYKEKKVVELAVVAVIKGCRLYQYSYSDDKVRQKISLGMSYEEF